MLATQSTPTCHRTQQQQCSRSRSAFTPLQQPVRPQRVCQQRGQLQVLGALSRARKEETVEVLVEKMQDSQLVFGMRFSGIDVKTMQAFRKTVPAPTLVCKNTLMRIAADRVDGFSELKEATRGDNCWVFANEEQIKDSVKAFLDFEKKMQATLTKEQKDAGLKITDLTGGCMDGKYIDPAALRKLENIATKKELIATVARLIKQVPTKLAVSVKQVPTKLARGIQAIADTDDNKDLIVGDVCKPKEA